MACALTSSLPLDCRDAVGGIKEIKVKVLPSLATITTDYTLTSGVVTFAANSRTGWYLYGIEKETASLTETTTVNVANGTVFNKQDLKIIFNKLSTKIRNEIQLLAQNRLQFAIRDMNDVYWLVGYNFGMDLLTSNNTTGTARGDRSGYELSFSAMEKEPMLNMTSATWDTLVT